MRSSEWPSGMRGWLDGVSAVAESVPPTVTVRYVGTQQITRSHTVNGLRLALGQETCNPTRTNLMHVGPTSLQTQRHQLPKPRCPPKPIPKNWQINLISMLARASRIINSIKTSDLLLQLDKFKSAVSRSPPKQKINPILTPYQPTCLNTIFTPPHKTNSTCLNTTIIPSQQQQLPVITELKPHQPQTETTKTENYGTHHFSFSIPITYRANQTLHKTLVPPSRDQPARDRLKDYNLDKDYKAE